MWRIKASATIRGELTKGNVTTALGYTPANQTDMTNAKDAITQLNSDYAIFNLCKYMLIQYLISQTDHRLHKHNRIKIYGIDDSCGIFLVLGLQLVLYVPEGL